MTTERTKASSRFVQANSLRHELGYRDDTLAAESAERVRVIRLIPDMTEVYSIIARFGGEKDSRDSIRFPSESLRDGFLEEIQKFNRGKRLDPGRWPIAFYGSSAILRGDMENYLSQNVGKTHRRAAFEFLRKAGVDPNHPMYGARLALLPTLCKLHDSRLDGERVLYPWPRVHSNRIADVINVCNREIVTERLKRGNDLLDSRGFFTVNSADAALELIRASHRSLCIAQSVNHLREYEIIRFAGIPNQATFDEILREVIGE